MTRVRTARQHRWAHWRREATTGGVSDRLHLQNISERLQLTMKVNAYMAVILRNSKDMGAVIRDRRRSKGLTQQALADAIGASRLWVNEVEQGKPRAVIGLVLKALAVLNVQLRAEDRTEVAGPSEIDGVVERARKVRRR